MNDEAACLLIEKKNSILKVPSPVPAGRPQTSAVGHTVRGTDCPPITKHNEMPSENRNIDLPKYFQLPEKEVAKKLGMSLTSLKKMCRQNGIDRWPYRKVRPQ